MGRRAQIRNKQRNKRIITISIVVAIIAVVVVLAFIVEASQSDPLSQYIGQPVQGNTVFPDVWTDLTNVSNSTLMNVGLPSTVTPPASVGSTASELIADGKPQVVYVGGEFCPFCAIERWSMIIALSHFGTFSNVQFMQSSSTDVNPDTPTFTFANATYTSKYIVFTPIEEYARNDATRQPLLTNQSTLVTSYDVCTSTGSNGGIPFVDVANVYAVNCGAQFQLPQIAGDNWTQVASQLNTPSSSVASEMDGAANTLITAICQVDGEQPSSLCHESFATLTLDSYTAPASSTGGQQNLLLSLLLPQARDEARWIG
jgi:hypothetical protein